MLEVTGITKRFGGLTAIDQASLTVGQGRIVALVGPNGAGKTTLFATIAGFLKPDIGTVRFEGTDITGRTPPEICRLGIARTFQIVQPFAGLSVRENIAVGAHLHHTGRREALERAGVVAEQVGMGKLVDQPASDLTVAGRKRLELARALATEPKLLLLDEVMAGLIPAEIDQIVEVIQHIRAEGVTILMIEHVMQAVMRLSDEVYVLAEGKMIAQGPPSSLGTNPKVVEAYLGHGAAERMKAGTL